MINIKNKPFKVILVTFLLSIFFISANPLLAQRAENDPLKGLNDSANKVTAFKGQTANFKADTFLQSKVGQAIGIILSFVGVLFLILMIYAGILWMTAQGNEQQVTKAKDMLINGVIGLIIVFAAYSITAFIGTELLK